MSETVYVAFASDDNYAQHLAVSIASLLKNASAGYPISISILSEGLAETHREKLLSLATLRAQTDISFITLSLDDFKNFPLHTGLHSIATYFRLKLPSLLPTVDKILYLDSDIAVCGDIREFWQQPIDNLLLRAIEEPRVLNAKRLAALGMKDDSPYFNGGILYMNLALMRETGFEAQVAAYIARYQSVILYQDQDVLNALCEGRWSPLPLCYNSFYFVLERIYHHDFLCYGADDIARARKAPFIIHFNQHPKPWSEGCIDPRRSVYFRYLAETPYRDFHVAQQGLLLPNLKRAWRNSLRLLADSAPGLYLAIRSVKRFLFR